MRKTAVIGLCKMLFAGKLKSPDLVSKLMLLWYDPAAGKTYFFVMELIGLKKLEI